MKMKSVVPGFLLLVAVQVAGNGVGAQEREQQRVIEPEVMEAVLNGIWHDGFGEAPRRRVELGASWHEKLKFSNPGKMFRSIPEAVGIPVCPDSETSCDNRNSVVLVLRTLEQLARDSLVFEIARLYPDMNNIGDAVRVELHRPNGEWAICHFRRIAEF